MGGYSLFHWLFVAALLAYLWLLVKISKPRPIAKPVKDSKAWLITQTVISWLCSFLFGFLTFGMVGMNANRQQRSQNPNPGDAASSVGYLGGAADCLFRRAALIRPKCAMDSKCDAQVESIEGPACCGAGAMTEVSSLRT